MGLYVAAAWQAKDQLCITPLCKRRTLFTLRNKYIIFWGTDWEEGKSTSLLAGQEGKLPCIIWDSYEISSYSGQLCNFGKSSVPNE